MKEMTVKTVRTHDHFGYGTVTDPGIRIPRYHRNGTKDGNRRAALLTCHPACGRTYAATWSDLLAGRTISCGCRGDTLEVQRVKREIRRLARTAGLTVTALRLAPRAEAGS